MPGKVTTSAGTVLSINATIPATFDAAGYAAAGMTAGWQVVGEITDPGELGRKYAPVKHTPINTRGVKKYKGSFDDGTMNWKMALDSSNAGQNLMRTARDSDNDYSFRVALPAGDILYFQGKVMDFVIGGLTVDSVVTASSSIEITNSTTGAGIIFVPAP